MQFIILLAGLVIILLGFFFYKRHRDLVRNCTMQTTGEVIRMERQEEVHTETDNDGHTRRRTSVTYHPVFQYTAGDRNIEKRSSAGSSHPQFNEGQSVTVMYDSANPERYYVVEDKTAGRFGIYCMAFGAVVLIIGVVALFVAMEVI